jgi:hypothetical protein
VGEEEKREAFEREWAALSEEVLSGMADWRSQHPHAIFSEIEAELDTRLARMRARMLERVAQQSAATTWRQPTSDREDVAPRCPHCGAPLQVIGAVEDLDDAEPLAVVEPAGDGRRVRAFEFVVRGGGGVGVKGVYEKDTATGLECGAYERPEAGETLLRDVREPEAEEHCVVKTVRLPGEEIGPGKGDTRSDVVQALAVQREGLGRGVHSGDVGGGLGKAVCPQSGSGSQLQHVSRGVEGVERGTDLRHLGEPARVRVGSTVVAALAQVPRVVLAGAGTV